MLLTKSEVLTERVVTKNLLVKTHHDQTYLGQKASRTFFLSSSLLFNQHFGQKASSNEVLPTSARFNFAAEDLVEAGICN
jgi:hypothetical protein